MGLFDNKYIECINKYLSTRCRDKFCPSYCPVSSQLAVPLWRTPRGSRSEAWHITASTAYQHPAYLRTADAPADHADEGEAAGLLPGDQRAAAVPLARVLASPTWVECSEQQQQQQHILTSSTEHVLGYI